jgi:hypothetical protein
MLAVADVDQSNGLVRGVGTVLMPVSQIHVAAGVPLLYSAPTGIAEPQRRPDHRHARQGYAAMGRCRVLWRGWHRAFLGEPTAFF